MTDKVISIYWFFILFIVASAIVYLVYTLYGTPLDVREMEATILSEKIASCLSLGGVLTSEGEILLGGESNGEKIFKVCDINSNTEDVYYWNDDQLFVSLTFFDEEKDIIFTTPDGNSNLKECNLYGYEMGKEKFPFCVNRTISFVRGKNDGGKYYTIEIFASVGKNKKNV